MNCEVVVGQRRQEVGEDGEDQGRTAELDAADEPLEEFEGKARFRTHDCGDCGGWCFLVITMC